MYKTSWTSEEKPLIVTVDSRQRTPTLGLLITYRGEQEDKTHPYLSPQDNVQS